MYFIEKIIKFCLNLNKKEEKIIAPEYDDNYVLEDIVTCSHHFTAVDSTGKFLACSKCGYLIRADRLKKKKKPDRERKK